MRQKIMAFFILASGICGCARDGACQTEGNAERFEVYTTADLQPATASLVSTGVWSVFGPITEPGFRLRADGLANLYGDGDTQFFASGFVPGGVKAAASVLPGYQVRLGDLWVKAYAGAAYQSTVLYFPSIGRTAQISAWGPAATLDVYWSLSERCWASSTVSWTSANSTVTGYARAGYAFYQPQPDFRISAGVEGGVAIDSPPVFRLGRRIDYTEDTDRAGLLLNLRLGSHDVSLSGGLATAPSEQAAHPYVLISYGKRF